MHEYMVTKNILEISIEEAKKANAKRINSINIVIGEFSTIIDESVKMYFDLFTEGTIANGAELIFKRVKAKFKCTKCENVFSPTKFAYECPKCRGLARPTDIGKEFYIDSIDVD
jgi:hydrogenase nickel incorporation protein HypA/HybF